MNSLILLISNCSPNKNPNLKIRSNQILMEFMNLRMKIPVSRRFYEFFSYRTYVSHHVHRGKREKSTMSKRLKRSRLELESLPDEMLLKIFRYMNMQELLQYGQVSKRTRAICSDESLWKDIELIQNRVKSEFIKSILDRNCEALDIRDTVIDGCVQLNRPSKLAYLSIKGFIYGDSTKDFIKEILNSCNSLEVLELVHTPNPSLNIVLQDLCKRNGETLMILNLAECRWISKKSAQEISNYCTQLEKITLFNIDMSQDAMDCFVSGLSPNVKEVLLSLNTTMTDEQVEKLVSRCNRITDLNIDSIPKLTDASITSVINHLKHSLETLSIVACKGISFEKVLELKSMPKLQILNYGFKSWHTMLLRKKLPHLKINQY